MVTTEIDLSGSEFYFKYVAQGFPLPKKFQRLLEERFSTGRWSEPMVQAYVLNYGPIPHHLREEMRETLIAIRNTVEIERSPPRLLSKGATAQEMYDSLFFKQTPNPSWKEWPKMIEEAEMLMTKGREDRRSFGVFKVTGTLAPYSFRARPPAMNEKNDTNKKKSTRDTVYLPQEEVNTFCRLYRRAPDPNGYKLGFYPHESGDVFTWIERRWVFAEIVEHSGGKLLKAKNVDRRDGITSLIFTKV